MKFSVVIPTRGDQDLAPIIESYDGIADEVLIWDNSVRDDLGVYGRYAMIEEARNGLILTQDDDCVVSDPQAIVEVWKDAWQAGIQGRAGALQFHAAADEHIVCNMPPEFRHDFYRDHALVGFGAVFHRDAPEQAFRRLEEADPFVTHLSVEDAPTPFVRTCDIVFTALTPRVLVDVPKENLPWATDEARMYRQPEHVAERSRMLELVRKVRGGE